MGWERDKIKRTEMIADYCDGGQKMLDIMEFNKSLEIAWIWNNSLVRIAGKAVFYNKWAKAELKNIEDLINV